MVRSISNEEQKKALIYSGAICLFLIILFFVIRWNIQPPTKAVVQDLITIDLGKDDPGHGEDPPLTKGNPTPIQPEQDQPQNTTSPSAQNDDPESVTDDNNTDAAPVNTSKSKSNKTPVASTDAKKMSNNPSPKLLYKGNNTGENGNNSDVDNEFRSQGKTPGAKGDEGSASGKIKTIPVSKSMMQGYQFQDELGTEKIYAKIRVNPDGNASWVGFEKKSTSRDNRYRDAIIRCLPKMKFEKESSTYEAVIIFDFKAN